MRIKLVLFIWLVALAVPAATPEVGKGKLRSLVKMPSIIFLSDWVFDPECGFTIGSEEQDKSSQIADLEKELKQDPGNAEDYLRLGALYAAVNDPTNAISAQSQAVELYRKRVELQPEDALLLAKFGHALAEAEKSQEAESVLRRAVRLGPKEWQCWLALGQLLDAESRRDLSGIGAAGQEAKGKNRLRAGPVNATPDRVTQVRKQLAEANNCFDQAVMNAPAEAEVFFRRGLHRTLQSFLLNDIREATGEHKPDFEVFRDCFSTESLVDLQRASQLRPKDYRLIGNTVLFEIYTVNARSGKRGVGDGFDWTTLSDETQRSIREAMTRLENLAQEPEAKVAAGALEVLGILQGRILHENSRCLVNLRRAMALDASREQAWEMMAGLLARAGNYQELLSVCEERLRQKDSARAHVLLAKAYERLKQWDNAEEQVDLALKQAPNDLTANLSLAALLLKRSEDPSLLAEANGWLYRCDQLLGAMPPQEKSRQLVIEFTLTRSIYLALTDDVESARKWVRTVIETDRENEQAREILAAMAY